jgi:hypothetical protein
MSMRKQPSRALECVSMSKLTDMEKAANEFDVELNKLICLVSASVAFQQAGRP